MDSPPPLPSISIIIPTRDRPGDLSELLETIVDQTYHPFETIIIDDSPTGSARVVAVAFDPKFGSVHSHMKYLKGTGEGITTARNIGIPMARGDALLFLDDDVLLQPDTVLVLADYFRENPEAVVVQPVITAFEDFWDSMGFLDKLENTSKRALMLSYHAKDKQTVRRSAASVYGSKITRSILVQKTSGCFLVRRKALEGVRFDANLRLWGLYEDVDFSYNVSRQYPGKLFCIPQARIVHKSSRQARLPRRLHEQMSIIYWAYTFFKDLYRGSMLNLTAFFWAFTGGLALSSIQFGLVRDSGERWAYIYRLEAYALCLRHLRSIMVGDIGFFNRTLPSPYPTPG